MSLNELLVDSRKPWCNLHVNTIDSDNGYSQGSSENLAAALTMTSNLSNSKLGFSATISGIPTLTATPFLIITIPNANCSFSVYPHACAGISAPSNFVGTSCSYKEAYCVVSRRVGAAAILQAASGQTAVNSGTTMTALALSFILSGGSTADNILNVYVTATLAGGATAATILTDTDVLIQSAEAAVA